MQKQQASASKPLGAQSLEAAKPVETKTAEATTAAAETKAAAAYTLTLPKDGSINDGLLSTFAKVSNELKVPQEAAQKLLDSFAPALQAEREAAVKEVQDEWIKNTIADKEIGGDKLKAASEKANVALAKVGTPELQQLLDETGLREHVEIIRLFSRLHSFVGEAEIVNGERVTGPKSEAQLLDDMYPSMRKK